MSRRTFNILHYLSRGATCIVMASLTGCAGRPGPLPRAVIGPSEYYHAVGLTQPAAVPSVLAQCAPPQGWKAEGLKQSDRHTHQVWLSPTGKTAYGVIHFSLPLPVGVNLVHWEFLREMRKREGEAVELSHQMDPSLPGMRFVCEDPRYKMRINLIVRGFEGWGIYAATLRNEEVAAAELELAEKSRENTFIGLPEREMSAKSE